MSISSRVHSTPCLSALRRWSTALLVFVVAPSPGLADDTIRIGMSAAFKGPSRGLGIELYRGSMAYFNEVNSKGGVNGRRIELLYEDDGYNPTPAINNTVKFMDDKVFLLYGYVGTPTVTRVLPLLKSNENAAFNLFFPFTGALPHRRPPYDRYVFNLRASYADETKCLVDNFLSIGRSRIAVFYQIDAYGRSGWNGVRMALEKHNKSMVGEATYKRGSQFEVSQSEAVGILRASDADAVISIGSYAACAAFVRDARNSGWDVPIANVSFVGSENLLNLLNKHGTQESKDYTTNLINTQVVPSYNDISLPAVREYRGLMEKYASLLPDKIAATDYQPLPQSFVSFEGYLDARLLVEVFKKMGSKLDRSLLKATVESMHDIDLGLGVPVSFGPGNHQGLREVYPTTVKDGAFVPLLDWKRWSK